jgi:hypothetical protein
VVALHTAVHDGVVSLLVDALLGHLGVDPVGVPPHVRANLAKLDRALGVVPDGVPEGLVELPIVEEDVGVVVPPVEVALDRLHGLDDALQLLVSREHDERSVGAGLARVGLEAACDEDLVVLLTDFSAGTLR